MELDRLTLAERAYLVWKEGEFLAATGYNNRKVNLYSLNGQFIEMWYDSAGNLIEKIIPMSIPELFKDHMEPAHYSEWVFVHNSS